MRVSIRVMNASHFFLGLSWSYHRVPRVPGNLSVLDEPRGLVTEISILAPPPGLSLWAQLCVASSKKLALTHHPDRSVSLLVPLSPVAWVCLHGHYEASCPVMFPFVSYPPSPHWEGK